MPRNYDVTVEIRRMVVGTATISVVADSFNDAEAAAETQSESIAMPEGAESITSTAVTAIARGAEAAVSVETDTTFPPELVPPASDAGYRSVRRQAVPID